MQNGGGEGGFLHKPAFWPLLHTKVFSRLRSPGVCIPPSAHPLPMPVRITNTSHSWLGRKRRERDGSGGEKQWGRGRPRPPARPGRVEQRAEAGKARPARQPARRAPGRPDREPGVGGAGGGWARARRRLGWVRPSTERPDEAETATSPSPPPPRGLGAKTKLGTRRRAPAGPSRVRSGLPAPPPAGRRETHRGRAGADGRARENQREALWKRLEMARAPPPPPLMDRDAIPAARGVSRNCFQGLREAGQSPRAAAWGAAQKTNSSEKRRTTPDDLGANRWSRRLSQWGNSAPPAGEPPGRGQEHKGVCGEAPGGGEAAVLQAQGAEAPPSSSAAGARPKK